MTLSCSGREGRIEGLRGPRKDPVTVASCQTGQRLARGRQKPGQCALARRIVRPPRQAGRAKRGDETWKKSFRRGLATTGLGKDPGRELEIDIRVSRQSEQAGGGVVRRPVGELWARAVVENDAHVRKPPGHALRLRN